MKYKITKILLAMALIFAQAIAVAPTASAADDKSNVQNVYNFGVTPVRQEVDLTPGETYTGTFKALNISQNNTKYRVYAAPYQLVGEDFATPDYKTVNRYTQIVDWITFTPSEGVIPAGENVDITYRIKVPANAAADGQYASLMVETVPDDKTGSTQVSQIFDVGMLLYARVAGNTNECVKILSNTVNSLVFEPNITAYSTVENCGNVHAGIKHTLQVFPIFSDEEVYTNEENPEDSVVLPETKRFVTSSWKDAPSFGIFRVKHTVTSLGETSVIDKIVIICPIWLLIIFIALIVTIILWLVSNHRQRKMEKSTNLANSGARTSRN